MCGIAGILHLNHQPMELATVKAMTDAIAHRGPDAQSQWADGVVGLGHRRLAIIDLSDDGIQPMTNEDGTVWITFNGEIYNFAEIRAELVARGHRFRSHSDTEVIIHGYEEWGRDCLKRLNGMFAFALWDKTRQELWVTRDRIGIKPLFYVHYPQHFFAFGSEIKALLATGHVNKAIDDSALSYYLALNYVPAPHTLWQDVRQLLPGQSLIIGANGDCAVETYWDLVYDETQHKSEDQWREELEARISEAVRLQLVSDVPFGSFLSGGVDSSTIVYWMSRHLPTPVKTFSIGFNNPQFDELIYARQVAQSLKTDHHERVVSPDMAEILPRLVWHSEEPTADSSMVAVYHVAQLARQHVTMTLSGDGADEIFAGYETYTAHYIHRLYRHIPSPLRHTLIEPLVNQMPTTHGKVSLDFKLKRFVKSGAMDSDAAHASWRTIFDGKQQHALLGRKSSANVVDDIYRPYFAQSNAKHAVNRLLYVDTRMYLPNDMLVKVDRMTMAHGLESRVPFLDHTLVEFIASIPPQLKLKWYRHKKYLLKQMMRGKLSDDILFRKKAGFNVPNASWISGELRPFVFDHLSENRIRQMGWFVPSVVTQLLNDHINQKADHSHQIWCLLTLSLWWQHFVA
jgi:asparagine synthase (glutamine-hydrolysing)